MEIGKQVKQIIPTMKQLSSCIAITVSCALLIACEPGTKGDSAVFAKVGDKTITQAEFDNYLAIKRVDKNRTDIVDKYKKEFLRKEQIAQAIETASVIDLDLLDAEMNESRKELVLGRYFEKYLNDKVNEDAVASFYSANADRYAANKAKVSHILIRTNPKGSEQERQAKSTLAHEIYSKLKTGESFEAMVEAFSDDAISKKKGGDLNWLSEGAIAPAFSQKVFSELKVGEFSEPVLTQLGYHIIKLVEGPAVVKSPLEKVKGDIRYQLRKEAKDAELERLASLVSVTNER